MKKKILICFFFLCLVIIIGQIYAGKEGSEEETNLSDRTIQTTSQEYLDAYNLFLKANVTDAGENTYSKAIESLKKVNQTTKSAEEKLNCLFLISFSSFLDGNTEEAYKMGLEALSLAKTIFKDNANISLLGKIKLAIENKEITQISEISSLLNLGEEATGLITDLYDLQERREGYQKIVKRCWEKYKPEFDKKIANISKEQGLSVEETEEIKKQLEEKYSKKGYFLPGEIEKSFAEIGLNNLFQ